MSATQSIDDLITAHLHLTSALGPSLPAMPEFYATEKAALDAVYAEIVGAHKARTRVGVRKTTTLLQRNAWADRADAAIARARHMIRATAPDALREYFPEKLPNTARRIDRLHAISRALTVSEHFGHAHLGDVRAELEAIRAEGEPIFDAASATVLEQNAEAARLRDLRDRWHAQYRKLKLLVRGYFCNTPTDWAKFFDEKRASRTGVREESPQAVPPGQETVARVS